MITNFEEETCPLSSEELKQIPLLIEVLKNTKKESPSRSDRVCWLFNNNKDENATRITGVRLRKLTNYIRSFGLLPIIATSKGYYCSYDKNEIKLQIQSLNERADAIRNSAKGLERFLVSEDDRQLTLFDF
jgi:hypothetical protein